MSSKDKVALEWSCGKAITKLFHYLDNRQYRELTDLFMADGVWHRAGTTHRGHEQIMDGMNKRSPTYKICHIVSNFLVLNEGKDFVEAGFYITAYANDSGKAPELPIQIKAPHSIIQSEVRFQLCDSSLYISELKLSTEFIF
jgi:hypothetical protein